MQTASMTMPATQAVADRILSFGASLPSRQRSIVNAMVEGGRSRLSDGSSLSAADAGTILAERARSNQDHNDARWAYEFWTWSWDYH